MMRRIFLEETKKIGGKIRLLIYSRGYIALIKEEDFIRNKKDLNKIKERKISSKENGYQYVFDALWIRAEVFKNFNDYILLKYRNGEKRIVLKANLFVSQKFDTYKKIKDLWLLNHKDSKIIIGKTCLKEIIRDFKTFEVVLNKFILFKYKNHIRIMNALSGNLSDPLPLDVLVKDSGDDTLLLESPRFYYFAFMHKGTLSRSHWFSSGIEFEKDLFFHKHLVLVLMEYLMIFQPDLLLIKKILLYQILYIIVRCKGYLMLSI